MRPFRNPIARMVGFFVLAIALYAFLALQPHATTANASGSKTPRIVGITHYFDGLNGGFVAVAENGDLYTSRSLSHDPWQEAGNCIPQSK